MTALPASGEIIDISGAAPRIEAMLPIGVRSRQLSVRTLLAGMCLTLADHRPAHLTRVHQALTSLPEDEQRRLGVIADWKHGPHQLTYRQTGYAFALVAAALGKDEPDGLPTGPLRICCPALAWIWPGHIGDRAACGIAAGRADPASARWPGVPADGSGAVPYAVGCRRLPGHVPVGRPFRGARDLLVNGLPSGEPY